MGVGLWLGSTVKIIYVGNRSRFGDALVTGFAPTVTFSEYLPTLSGRRHPVDCLMVASVPVLALRLPTFASSSWPFLEGGWTVYGGCILGLADQHSYAEMQTRNQLHAAKYRCMISSI